jgi:hypothetical protein
MAVDIKLIGFENQNINPVNTVVEKFLSKVYRMMKEPDELVIDLKIHQARGRKKFSVKMKMVSASGLFNSHAFGWTLMDVVQDGLSKLEREIKTKHEKRIAYAEKSGLARKEAME